MHIVLFEPEIPPNTGNIARLCAATLTPLHLIEPLGFSLEDKYLRRAGLDYWPHVDVTVWPSWPEFTESMQDQGRMVLTSGRQGVPHHEFVFETNDFLVFGPETRGLPREIFDAYEHQVRVPVWGKVRSLNLSTCAGIVLYEALRQTGGLNNPAGACPVRPW